MLLQLYYLYDKSAKKSRELVDIVNDLRETYDFSSGQQMDHTQEPCYSASFWCISQPLINALSRQGHQEWWQSTDSWLHSKWSQSKLLVGCALYVDLLKHPSLLSLTLQEKNLDLVLGIKHILKTIKSLKGLASQDSLQWPTVKLVCSRIKDGEGGKQYQEATLKNYNSATTEYCKEQAMADLNHLDLRMRDRHEWSDVKLLRSILIFVDTQGWQAKSNSTDTGVSDSEDEQTLWRKSS